MTNSKKNDYFIYFFLNVFVSLFYTNFLLDNNIFFILYCILKIYLYYYVMNNIVKFHMRRFNLLYKEICET